MKRYILILTMSLLNLIVHGQKCAMSTISSDTLYIYIENLQTTEIKYFNIDTSKIVSLSVIKNADQSNIYGNPKGGKVKVCLKPSYFRGLKIGQILKTEFNNSENILFYVNGNLSTKKDFMDYKVKRLYKIEFIKQDLEVCRMNLTTRKK